MPTPKKPIKKGPEPKPTRLLKKADRLDKRADKQMVRESAARATYLSVDNPQLNDRQVKKNKQDIENKYSKWLKAHDKTVTTQYKADNTRKKAEIKSKMKSDMAAVKAKYSKKK